MQRRDRPSACVSGLVASGNEHGSGYTSRLMTGGGKRRKAAVILTPHRRSRHHSRVQLRLPEQLGGLRPPHWTHRSCWTPRHGHHSVHQRQSVPLFSFCCCDLLTHCADSKQARDLVNILTESKQQIDPRLAEMARYGGGGGGGRYGGGRGRGGGRFGGRGGGGGYTGSNNTPLSNSRW